MKTQPKQTISNHFADVGKKVSIRERLAELEHEQWKEWALEILKTEKISKARTARWHNYILTPYEVLPKEVKEQDRKWADKVIAVISDLLATLPMKSITFQPVGGMSNIEYMPTAELRRWRERVEKELK